MNSSGIKRGLATTAVSALAIAGIPFIATSASAAPGDTLAAAYEGPALNGGSAGAVVILEVNEGSVTQAELDAGLLKITGVSNDAVGSQNTGTQALSIVGTPQLRDDVQNAVNNDQEFGDNDGQDEIVVRVSATTTPVGGTASGRIFIDDTPTDDTLDAGEARDQIDIATAGPVASISVAPDAQTRPVGVESAPYVATFRDAAGRLTQTTGTTTIDGNGATINPSDNAGDADETVLTADQVARGTTSFRATGPMTSVYNLTVTNGNVVGNATLSTTAAASIAANEVDIVTNADDWRGFGNPQEPGGPTTNLAPTQSQVTFNFRSRDNNNDGTPDDANTTVTLNFAGTGVTFGGQQQVSKNVTLGADGTGSIVLDVDPGTIQLGDQIAVTGSFAQTLVYANATPGTIAPGAARYVGQIDGNVTVTARVLDNYGNPVTSGEVSADIISGPNANAANGRDQRKPVGADGTVSFTFTDVNAAVNQTDTVEFRYFTSQFEPNPANVPAAATTTIRWTADGQGADFTTTLDNVVATGPGYNPATNPIVPLTDAVAETAPAAGTPNEDLALNVVGGEPNSAITVTADNGGLILEPNETLLSQASASVTDVTTNAGALPTGYRVIGTDTGTVTVTVTNAGRTETSTLLVQSATNASGTARNVELTGPESAVGGDVVTFIATITDAFGNPVAGFSRNGVNGQSLNVTVSGPGALQDGSAVSDANGEIALNVRLADGADSPVTVNVTATGAQFGAAENRRFAGDATNTGPGLSASDNTASATIDEVTDIEALEEAVEEAERNLAESQASLAAAQADLDVAQAQLAIAQSEVDRLQERKQNLRQKLNKAKRNDNRQKAKTTRKKLRSVKSQLRDARQAVTVAQAAVDGEQAVVDLRQAEVTEAEEALAQAQADLEEAQG